MATTSYDGTATIWDAHSGQRVRRFSFSSMLKRGVAWSSDSQRLAWGSVGDENAIRIWDSRTDEIHILRGHTHSLISCCWSPDGTRLATTSMDHTARIWDTATWNCLQTLQHTSFVTQACWLNGSADLVTVGGMGGGGGVNYGVFLWDSQTGEMKGELPSHNDFRSASINANSGSRLAIGKGNGQCMLIDIKRWQVMSTHDAHAGPVHSIAFSPDGSTYASGGVDGRVNIWDTSTGLLMESMLGNHGPANSVAWNPNGRQIAVGYDDGRVRLWEFPSLQQPLPLQTQQQTDAIHKVQWKQDGKSLIANSASARIDWEFDKKEATQTEALPPKSRELLSPDGRLRARANMADKESTVVIERVDNGDLEAKFTLDFSALRGLAWSPNSQRLAVWQYGHCEVLDVLSGQRLFSWRGIGIADAAWADKRRLAVAAGGDVTDGGYVAHMGFVHLLDVDQKKRIHKLQLSISREKLSCVSWSKDGQFVAAGSPNGSVAVWNATTGKGLSLSQPHIAAVNGLDWTPDSRRIASVSQDGSVKLWEPASGDELLSFQLDNQPLTAVSWSPDGQRLAVGNNTGMIRIWDASLGYAITQDANFARSLARIHYQHGRSSYLSGDVELAMVHYTRAVELAPSRPQYRRGRANLLARSGEVEAALVDLNAALDFEPDDSIVLGTRLNVHAERGDWTSALADANRFHELKRDAYSTRMLAVIYVMLGQEQEYRKCCQSLFVGTVQELMPVRDPRLFTCAIRPKAFEDFDRVVPVVRQLIHEAANIADPCAPDATGGLLYRAGQLEEAIDFLTEASRKWEQPGSVAFPLSTNDRLPAYTWYFLAMTCHDLARYSESRAWYDKAEAYTQAVLAPPNETERLTALSQLGNHNITWLQRAELQLLQAEARQVLAIADSK